MPATDGTRFHASETTYTWAIAVLLVVRKVPHTAVQSFFSSVGRPKILISLNVRGRCLRQPSVAPFTPPPSPGRLRFLRVMSQAPRPRILCGGLVAVGRKRRTRRLLVQVRRWLQLWLALLGTEPWEENAAIDLRRMSDGRHAPGPATRKQHSA